VIVEPLAFGVPQLTVTCWLATCVEEMNGASGTTTGDAALVETLAPWPTALVAETLKVYEDPFVSPVTVQVFVEAPEVGTLYEQACPAPSVTV
jgi:hypothetical protein